MNPNLKLTESQIEALYEKIIEGWQYFADTRLQMYVGPKKKLNRYQRRYLSIGRKRK